MIIVIVLKLNHIQVFGWLSKFNNALNIQLLLKYRIVNGIDIACEPFGYFTTNTPPLSVFCPVIKIGFVTERSSQTSNLFAQAIRNNGMP